MTRLRLAFALLTVLVAFGLESGSAWAQPAAVSSGVAPSFAAVTETLEAAVHKQQIAGGVAFVLQHGRPVYVRCVGNRDIGRHEPMSEDTLFRIASMTKPVTCVAVMMLVEEGKLSLDQPVSSLLPEFAAMQVECRTQSGEQKSHAAARQITIHDLLTHTSGLSYGFLAPEPQRQAYRQAGICDGLEDSTLSLAENAARLSRLPLVDDPGRSWGYSLSTDVLGRVIEVASGVPFEQFIHSRICQPLAMHDTDFIVPPEKVSRLATLYRPAAKGGIEVVPEGSQSAGSVHYSATSQLPGHSHCPSGGGGLVSTAGDYSRFLTMLLNGGSLGEVRLLKPETVARMTSNQIGNLQSGFPIHGDGYGYGFGVHSAGSNRLGAGVGTYSWGGIFNTYFWVDPQNDVIGILMTQLIPFDHLTLWSDFQRSTYEGLRAEVPQVP